MALAKRCDRCGELYDDRNRSIRNQRVNGLMMIERYYNNAKYDWRGYLDLCPRCLESFDTWLKMEFEPMFTIKDDGIHISHEYGDKEEENAEN